MASCEKCTVCPTATSLLHGLGEKALDIEGSSHPARSLPLLPTHAKSQPARAGSLDPTETK